MSYCAEKLPKCCNRFGRMLLMILNCPIRLNLPPIHFTAALTENWSHIRRVAKGYCSCGSIVSSCRIKLCGDIAGISQTWTWKLSCSFCNRLDGAEEATGFRYFYLSTGIHFYHRCGGWLVNPNVTLIGNAKPGALNSKTLSVAVLQRIFSRHAQKHKVLLTHGLINLEFPDGEFL